MHTHAYCCLDYAQIYDVVRYRLHRMKKKLKDELESKNTVQEYICPNCSKRYTALDALRLISPYDEYFHCESFNGVLVAESDKLTAQGLGDGDDNARRRRHEILKDMLTNMEENIQDGIDRTKVEFEDNQVSLNLFEKVHPRKCRGPTEPLRKPGGECCIHGVSLCADCQALTDESGGDVGCLLWSFPRLLSIVFASIPSISLNDML